MANKKTTAPKAAGSGENEVDRFMAALDHPLKAEIEAIRALILGADRRIKESVKWNAPSFSIDDHFATLKLYPPAAVQVVLHTGARVKSNSTAMEIRDPSSLLKWAAVDRCLATFSSMEDVTSNGPAFEAILKQWIEQL